MTIHVTTRCACGGRGILCYDDVWGPDLRWSVECDTCDAMGPGRATPGQADRAWSIMHGVALHMVRAAIDMMESEILEIFDRPTKPIGIDVRHIPIGGTTNLPAHREAWHKALAPAPTAVYVTVEVDGVERAYECLPVAPEPQPEPTVTWGGAKMPLRPMPGLKPGMPVLLWRVDGWSIGHLEYETWIRLHESDDIYGLRDFQGWVPMPDVGR